MSATPGKIMIDGIAEVGGEDVFVLKFIQGRNSEWVNKVFFASYNEDACWITDLKPAFGDKRFFYEKHLREIKALNGVCSQAG